MLTRFKAGRALASGDKAVATEEQKIEKPAVKTSTGGAAPERAAQGMRLQQYLQETRSELRKVVWPTREQAIDLTVVVLTVTLVMTVILGGLDWFFSALLEFIIRSAGGA